jgi:DNA repair ATPase RecN
MQGLHVPEEVAAAAQEAGGQGYRVRRAGLDAVEFLLAAGPAEPLRTLGAVASGGESARVMLALKAAPALAMAATTGGEQPGAAPREHASSEAASSLAGAAGGAQIMVLDELDSGVGGRLGGPVARLLRRMSLGAASQILCVSHLPQARRPFPQEMS